MKEGITRIAPKSKMFEQAFKNIDDVLWKEAGCTAHRVRRKPQRLPPSLLS